MNIETFNKLKQIADKELTFDEKKADIACANVPAMYQRYLDIYSTEFHLLKTKQADLEMLYGELYKKVKFHDQYQWGAKGEVDSQINTNVEYYRLRIEVAQQEVIVQYLEQLLDNIKRLSYTIKNWIDIKKFMAGMY